MSEYRTSIDIDAVPETVFQFLVTDQGMATWMGQWASLNPVPGGRFEVNVAGYPVRPATIEATFAPASTPAPPGTDSIRATKPGSPAPRASRITDTNPAEAIGFGSSKLVSTPAAISCRAPPVNRAYGGGSAVPTR